MKESKELKGLIEKLIDFSYINIGFKVEFKDRGSKKRIYVITENENGCLLEIKEEDRPLKVNLSSSKDLQNQKDLPDEGKKIFFELFNRLNSNQVDNLYISGLRLRNPILTASIGQSIIANISKQISSEDRAELYRLWKEKKEKFEEKFQDIVIDIIISQLKDKLESADLPTPIFPTSVALSEIPNYYICEPKEIYTLDTKIELFNKLADSICGRCGQGLYGLYVPEEGIEIKEILKTYVPDFYNVNIGSIAGVGRINLREMLRGDKIPAYHVELFTIEGVGGGKKFFSHYVIPNLNEVQG